MKSQVRTFLPRRLALAVALSSALAATSPPEVGAGQPRHADSQTHVVMNCNDSGSDSLREAYASAVDGDHVDLSQLECSTITLTSGPIVSAPAAGYVTLHGSYDHLLTVSGNHAARVIVHHGTVIAVNGLHIVAGVANDADGGGCIYSSGEVSLLESTVSDCEVSTLGSTPARGGGIRALNSVVMRKSTLTGNRVHAAASDADGGGVHALVLVTMSQSTISDNTASGDGSHFARGGGAFASAYVSCEYTTLSGNDADGGGAIYVANSNVGSTPTLTNVTISGNHASGAAGGIFGGRGIKVYNSTITGNTAVFEFGAGIYLSAGNLELHSTIVANNSTGSGLNAADIAGHSGATITGAYNLVIASTLVLPGGTLSGDPMLAPLADNGGGVLTHALLPGSPAIDAGENPLGLFKDERGFICAPGGQCNLVERELGAATDIGAFELGGPDHIFDNGFDPQL